MEDATVLQFSKPTPDLGAQVASDGQKLPETHVHPATMPIHPSP